VLTLVATTYSAAQHPGPQPRPTASQLTVESQVNTVGADGVPTTTIVSATSPLPVGANQLQFVQSNNRDGLGNEMVNTLPSTPTVPFNLLAAPVQTSPIDKTSPKDDLNQLLADIQSAANGGTVDQQKIQAAIDILEGNPIPNRVYSGFPLLHYNGPNKLGHVTLQADGTYNVNVHQIWYDNHIESDTALLDVSQALIFPW